jgi:hypothetical protein
VIALAEMTGPWAAYNAAAQDVAKTGTTQSGNTVREYSIYWRPGAAGGVKAVEVFGLESDQVGRTPAGYTDTDPAGWTKQSYISTEAFYSQSGAAKGAYKFDFFYDNTFGDPWPRSTWPIFGQTLSSSQGALVNDFGY